MRESIKLILRKKDKIEMSDLLILKSLSLSILLAWKEEDYYFPELDPFKIWNNASYHSAM